MKSKTNYKNIKNLQSLLKFFYYATIVYAIMSAIITLAIPLLPISAITFESGVREWFYSIKLPVGSDSSFFLQSSIPNTILPLVPIEDINVNAIIIIYSFMSSILLIVLIHIGLKKLMKLASDILNNESPFQLKHIKSLRDFSLGIILYSTLSNTVMSMLFSLFVINSSRSIPLDFMWSGIFIGILGYIFSDITEYGLFLQDEYDSTL